MKKSCLKTSLHPFKPLRPAFDQEENLTGSFVFFDNRRGSWERIFSSSFVLLMSSCVVLVVFVDLFFLSRFSERPFFLFVLFTSPLFFAAF